MQVKTLLIAVRAQRLRKPHSRRRFAFPERRRRDRGHIDVFAVGTIFETVAHFQMHFGFVFAIQFEVILFQPYIAGDIQNRAQFGGLGNFDITRHGMDNFYRHENSP